MCKPALATLPTGSSGKQNLSQATRLWMGGSYSFPSASSGSQGHVRIESFESSMRTKLCVILHLQCPACLWVIQALIKVLRDSSVFSKPLRLIRPDRKSCRNGFSCLNLSQACFEGYLEVAGRQSWKKEFPQFEPWLGTGSQTKSGFLKS